jgi:hypothetical protein
VMMRSGARVNYLAGPHTIECAEHGRGERNEFLEPNPAGVHDDEPYAGARCFADARDARRR